MKILKFRNLMILLLSLTLIVAFGMTFPQEPEKIKVAGEHKVAYTVREEVEVGDAEGHIIYLTKMEGANASKGEVTFMDGAKVINTGFADYVKSNGKHWGYSIMMLNGDMIISKYKGETTTKVSEEGETITTLNGKFKMIKGTGKYENIEGSGTYKSKVIAEKEVVTQWEGEYFIKK
jgi:hypothetical protein